MVRASSRRRRRSRPNTSNPVAKLDSRRKIPAYELLDEESLLSLENHAEWLLTEIGIEIRGDAEALRLFKEAGASLDGERLRFDPRTSFAAIMLDRAPHLHHARAQRLNGMYRVRRRQPDSRAGLRLPFCQRPGRLDGATAPSGISRTLSS